MSIWISKKEKSYAGSPTANWLKRYVEYLTKGMKETLEQEIVDHCDGTAFPHSADAINFEGSGSVQDAIQKEIADRKAADNEVRNRLTEEQQVRANAIQELAGDLTGKKPLDFVVRVTTTGMVAYGNYQFESADKSYAEILDAYNEGKNVYLLINNIRVAQLHSVGYAIQFFTTQGPDKHIIFSVNAENTWQVKVNLYYTTDEVDNELTKKADVTALNKKADAEEVNQKFSDLESALNNMSGNADTPLKLIKTITLTDAVTSIETTFEKPLKEIYMVFTGTLDGITDAVSDCIISAKCDGGS